MCIILLHSAIWAIARKMISKEQIAAYARPIGIHNDNIDVVKHGG
jgi:hypothetical protein